jgi:hypothetical protein
MFQCQAISGKEKKEKRKKLPFRQNVVVAATFLDFVFSSKDQKIK